MIKVWVVVWRWSNGDELRCGPAWPLTRRAALRRLARWRRRLPHADLRVEQVPLI